MGGSALTEPRFCQCGKPAGHVSVCNLGPDDGDRDIERVDRGWEEQNARHREERFAKHQRASQAERRERRASLGALELHRHAVERALRLSTVAAGNVEPGRGGDGPAGPPHQQTMDDDPRWREHEAVLRSRLERMHELLDEAEGHGSVSGTALMTTEHKNWLILAEEGLSPIAVVEKLGRDIAGSPDTVRRIRRAHGRSALDGRKTDATGSAEVPIWARARRVVIDDGGAR